MKEISPSMGHMELSMRGMHHHMGKNMSITWKSLFKTGTHCGSGCTLADIIGETFVLFVPIVIAGSPIWGN